MNLTFWQDRWQRNEIGFHQDTINPFLLAFWPRLGVAQDQRVLVPLCGKTQDMLWLAQQGHRVVGVEVSTIAVEAFFKENGLQAEVLQRSNSAHWSCGPYEIICGDFFALTKAQIGQIDAVYDRASLVALPPERRHEYAQQLKRLVTAEKKVLLITFVYPQHEMDGPPFSVTEQEVDALYADTWTVTLLHTEDILADKPRFRDKGVTKMEEKVYLFSAKSG